MSRQAHMMFFKSTQISWVLEMLPSRGYLTDAKRLCAVNKVLSTPDRYYEALQVLFMRHDDAAIIEQMVFMDECFRDRNTPWMQALLRMMANDNCSTGNRWFNILERSRFKHLDNPPLQLRQLYHAQLVLHCAVSKESFDCSLLSQLATDCLNRLGVICQNSESCYVSMFDECELKNILSLIQVVLPMLKTDTSVSFAKEQGETKASPDTHSQTQLVLDISGFNVMLDFLLRGQKDQVDKLILLRAWVTTAVSFMETPQLKSVVQSVMMLSIRDNPHRSDYLACRVLGVLACVFANDTTQQAANLVEEIVALLVSMIITNKIEGAFDALHEFLTEAEKIPDAIMDLMLGESLLYKLITPDRSDKHYRRRSAVLFALIPKLPHTSLADEQLGTVPHWFIVHQLDFLMLDEDLFEPYPSICDSSICDSLNRLPCVTNFFIHMTIDRLMKTDCIDKDRYCEGLAIIGTKLTSAQLELFTRKLPRKDHLNKNNINVVLNFAVIVSRRPELPPEMLRLFESACAVNHVRSAFVIFDTISSKLKVVPDYFFEFVMRYLKFKGIANPDYLEDKYSNACFRALTKLVNHASMQQALQMLELIQIAINDFPDFNSGNYKTFAIFCSIVVLLIERKTPVAAIDGVKFIEGLNNKIVDFWLDVGDESVGMSIYKSFQTLLPGLVLELTDEQQQIIIDYSISVMDQDDTAYLDFAWSALSVLTPRLTTLQFKCVCDLFCQDKQIQGFNSYRWALLDALVQRATTCRYGPVKIDHSLLHLLGLMLMHFSHYHESDKSWRYIVCNTLCKITQVLPMKYLQDFIGKHLIIFNELLRRWLVRGRWIVWDSNTAVLDLLILIQRASQLPAGCGDQLVPYINNSATAMLLQLPVVMRSLSPEAKQKIREKAQTKNTDVHVLLVNEALQRMNRTLDCDHQEALAAGAISNKM